MIQAFTDLVGTSAVPALSINIEELTELTPALETAAVDHGTSLEASEAKYSSPGCASSFDIGC
jgi:hypothetical protein